MWSVFFSLINGEFSHFLSLLLKRIALPKEYIGEGINPEVRQAILDVAEKYKQLALNELEIADGITVRENNVSEDEMLYTVDTYKKLQMQQEAKKYISSISQKMILILKILIKK